jgi:hypothetical protein
MEWRAESSCDGMGRLDRTALPVMKAPAAFGEPTETDMRGAVVIGIVLAGLAGPAQAQQGPASSEADTRELLEAARATAKAARENVDYARVVPDILTQILAKLDKIEDKLDKVEEALKDKRPRRGNAR